MSEPLLELPGSYSYGYVVGGVIRAQVDSVDDVDRLPQGSPVSGKVTFVPLNPVEYNLDDPPRIVLQDKSICTLSAKTGLLMDPQSSAHARANPEDPEVYGVWLVTGDYRVEFQLNNGNIAPFDIRVETHHTESEPLFLSEAAGYQPPAGTAVTIMKIPPGLPGRVLAWSDDGLVWIPAGEGSGGGTNDWALIANKPTYIGAGSTQAAARGAIGAIRNWSEIVNMPNYVAAGPTQEAARLAIGITGTGGGGGAGYVVLGPTDPDPDPIEDGVLYVRLTGATSSPPAVIGHPQSVMITEGQNATFGASAVGTPTPTAQWQINQGSGWSNIPSATSLTYEVGSATLAMSGYQYRVVFTNTQGSATTSAAVMTVVESGASPTVPVITLQPTAQTVEVGESAVFTATASGIPSPSVTWQLSTNSGSSWTPISGATTNTLTVSGTTLGHNNRQYRAIFTNTAGSATTNAALLTVEEPTGGGGGTPSWSDDFERSNGPVGNGWQQLMGSGVGTITSGNMSIVGGSGYQMIGQPSQPGELSFRAYIGVSAGQYTGIFIGRGGGYPGIKLFMGATGGGAGFVLNSADTSSNTGIETPLRAYTDGSGGGEIGLQLDGGVIPVLWNGTVIFTTSDATTVGYANPAGGFVGICGTATNDNWNYVEVYTL